MGWVLVQLALGGEGIASRAFVPAPLVGRPLLEIRGGLDHATVPLICGEVHLLRLLSVDACGTGSSLFHQRALDEMSHYRVEGDVPLLRRGRLEAWWQPGLGFAEVQRGADAPGYRFRAGDTAEAAGPEATMTAKGRAWVHEGVYATAELNLGLAWIPAAPATVGTPATLPSGALTVGLGF